MINEMIATGNSLVALVLRITIGIVVLPHALQKMFSWFDGPGIKGELKFMTEIVGLPAFVAMTAIIVECAGIILMITGTATRFVAIIFIIQFIGIILTVHRKNGFFMNWFGKLPAGQEGFEFHLLVLGILTVLLIEGGGRFSIDKWITSHKF